MNFARRLHSGFLPLINNNSSIRRTKNPAIAAISSGKKSLNRKKSLPMIGLILLPAGRGGEKVLLEVKEEEEEEEGG